MVELSVVICCANVGDTLEAACRSVAWADELVVVDSGSTDETPAIARRFAHRYLIEPWRGFTGQRQFGVSLASHDWVLILDGDEECSPALVAELERQTPEELSGRDMLLTRRRTYVMNRPVRAWWPDWQGRIVHRGRIRWKDEALHAGCLPSAPGRTAKLTGWLEHRRTSQGGFRDYFDGALTDDRLALVATEMYNRGRRCGWTDVVFRPPLAFLKWYLLNFGCLDGLFGYLMAQSSARAVQVKYAALWAHQQGIPLAGKQRRSPGRQ